MRTDTELAEWFDVYERRFRQRLADGGTLDGFAADLRDVHDTAGDRGVRLAAELVVLHEEAAFRYLEWSERGAPWMPYVRVRDKIRATGAVFRDLVGWEFQQSVEDNQRSRDSYDDVLGIVERRRAAKAGRSRRPAPPAETQAGVAARRSGVGFADPDGSDDRPASRGPDAATHTGENQDRAAAAYARAIEARALGAFGGQWS